MVFVLFDFWLQFMQGFGFVMRYAQQSTILKMLVSGILSLAFLNILNAVAVIRQKVAAAIATRKLKRMLDRQPTPIKIESIMTTKKILGSLLVWKDYDTLPLAMLLENNGSTAILRICCESHSVPHLSGGELPGKYHFVEACFKWGLRSAEHSIDSVKFSLEMQVLHRCYENGVPLQYVTVSYLFFQTGKEHLPLTQITENLRSITDPDSQMEMPPFDLASVMKPFVSSFYSYQGTYDNGGQVVPTMWLICSHIFNISSEQLAQFHVLCGRDGQRIKCNARQEQPLGDRALHFHI